MKTRDSYIAQRTSMQFDINELYDFYKEKCTKDCIDIREFEMKLPVYLSMGGNFNKYISEMDAHYNILKLTHNNGIAYY